MHSVVHHIEMEKRMPTATKTKRPAQSQAAKTEVHPIGAPTPRKAVPVIPRSIGMITDAVSEMLTTGTADTCLDKLLTASLEHITRRTYERGIGTEDQNVIRAGIDREVKGSYQDWKQDIIATWRHHRRQSPAAIEPATLTERIRLNAREKLEGLLDGFVGRATPEEVSFLLEVMQTWDSQSYLNPILARGEIGIGNAFETELGQRDVNFITVPGRMTDKVTAYVDALRTVEDKAA
jgi:hypothetical protein